MEDMEHEAERLQRIIDNLLVLARFEAGKELPTEPLLVRRAIVNVIEAYRRRMGGREISVSIGDDVVPVASEETYFEQVLHNLIGNAAKYSPPGAPIDVQAEREGDEVVVLVLDRGSGISEEDTTQIFEPFFRSRRTAGQAGGAGLGLAVCKRLVEAQGGRIWARPREGGGSEFGFALPAFPDFT
jgi:signal transduction histidine kinase